MKFGFLAIARSVGVAACLFALSTVSQAGYITSVTGSGSGWSLTGVTVVTNDTNGTANTSPGGNAFTGNTITLNLTALELNTPFTLKFSTDSENSTWDNISRRYNVVLNVTRALTTPNALHATMNGFDFARTTVGGNYPVSIRKNVAAMGANFSPGLFAFQQPNPVQGNLNNEGWRFGGLNGGGPGLAQTATTTVKFQFNVGQSDSANPGDFTEFVLTANPEPTTLLLGSLVMVPAGIAIRRRRKAAAAAEAAV